MTQGKPNRANRAPQVLAGLTLLLLSTSATHAAERYALLVGVNDYPNFTARMQLSGCENDARYVRKELVERYGFPAGNVRVVLSGEATRQGVLSGLDWLASASSEGDVCVFYFSGHGSQLPDDDGDESDKQDEILCPTDFKLTSETSGSGYIRDDELNDIAKRFADRQFVSVFDCCHSGTGLRSLLPYSRGKYLFYEGPRAASTGGTRSLGGTRGMFYEPASPSAGDRGDGRSTGFADAKSDNVSGSGAAGAVLIAAARSNEPASESEPVEIDGETRVHGCLTLKLMRGLRGEANTNGDKTLSFGELRRYLDGPLETPRGIQHPQVEADADLLDRGVFETRGIVLEVEEPKPAMTSFEPLAVRVAILSGFVDGDDEGLDLPAGRRVRDEITSLLSRSGDYRVVPSGAPYQAMVVCSAKPAYGGLEYEAGVVDGGAQLQKIIRGVGSDSVVDQVLSELKRMRTVRNLTRLRPPVSSPYRLELSLAGGGNRLRVGEQIGFVCRANRTGYVTIININSAGEMTLLYPNEFSGGTRTWRVEGGARDVRIPHAGADFEIVVEPPLGREFVIALLTPEPLDMRSVGLDPNAAFSSASSEVDQSGAVFRGLTRSLGNWDKRGMKVKKKTSPGGAVAASGQFSPLNSNNWASATVTFETVR